jgi:hypothetical protein
MSDVVIEGSSLKRAWFLFNKLLEHDRNMHELKLLQRLTLIMSSRAISHVNLLKVTDVSGTISVPIIRAMMAL